MSALADGTDLPLALTVTVPFMPAWMLQKYVNLPAFLKVTVIGLGLSASGRPLTIRLLPLNESFLPNAPGGPSDRREADLVLAVEPERLARGVVDAGRPSAPVGRDQRQHRAAARREVERVEADGEELDLVALVDRHAVREEVVDVDAERSRTPCPTRAGCPC